MQVFQLQTLGITTCSCPPLREFRFTTGHIDWRTLHGIDVDRLVRVCTIQLG